MLTIKVLSPDGWQNGDKLWSQGKMLELDVPQSRVQPYIDAGVIELVTATIDVEGTTAEQKRQAETNDTIAKTADAIALAIKGNMPTIKIKERVDDDPNSGFVCFADFAKEVWVDQTQAGGSKKLREYDARTKTAGHMSEGDSVQGGHLVPTGFRASLLQTSLENSFVRQRATFIPMATNRIGIPAIRDYDHSNGTNLYTALAVKRPGEAGTKDPSKPNFDLVTLTLHKTVFFTYVSEELLEDSPISVEPLLNNLFGRGLAWHEDNDFINGTGVNMPLGILNAPALISVTRQPATGYLSYLDLVTMWSRLHPSSMGSAVWLVSPSLLPYLYTACIVCTGSDGSDLTGAPVMLAAGGANDSPYTTLFGRPIIVTEHCQAAGTVGDIYLADFSQYLVGGKSASGSPKMDSSIHLSFNTDEVAYRAVLRYDGAPWWQTTLTPKFGSATLSPFIALTTKT